LAIVSLKAIFGEDDDDERTAEPGAGDPESPKLDVSGTGARVVSESTAGRDINLGDHYYGASETKDSAYPQVRICKTTDSLRLCVHNFSTTAVALDIHLDWLDRRMASYILASETIATLPAKTTEPLTLRIDLGRPAFGYPTLTKREVDEQMTQPHMSIEEKVFNNLVAIEEKRSGWTPAVVEEMSVVYTDRRGKQWKSTARVRWQAGLMSRGTFDTVEFLGITTP